MSVICVSKSSTNASAADTFVSWYKNLLPTLMEKLSAGFMCMICSSTNSKWTKKTLKALSPGCITQRIVPLPCALKSPSPFQLWRRVPSQTGLLLNVQLFSNCKLLRGALLREALKETDAHVHTHTLQSGEVLIWPAGLRAAVCPSD